MSIRENLNLVNKNKEKQIEICKEIGIHKFIMSLDNGYDTIIRENSTNLSGGQKRLLSFARTLLNDSEILLFDEISSSLDPDTTKKIIEILKRLKTKHTIVMITHKEDIMKVADKIIVMDNGKKVGEGTYKNLINKNKYYKKLSHI